MPAKTKRDIHKEVADKLIAMMEEHGTGWTKPWAGDFMEPVSMSTGKPYQGINWMILSIAIWSHKYTSGQFATFNQWKTRGAQVRKGEKGTTVILYKPVEITDKQTGEKETVPLLRTFTVFNADQVDGYEPPAPVPAGVDVRADTAADALAADAGARVLNQNNSAYYSPDGDYINMPPARLFNSVEGYACTLLHELTHWTGHKARCDRDLKNTFGTGDYAAEELVAELGAAMLAGSLGISAEPRADHAQYLNNWIRLLKDNPKAIFTAAAKAQAAANWLYETAAARDERAAA